MSRLLTRALQAGNEWGGWSESKAGNAVRPGVAKRAHHVLQPRDGRLVAEGHERKDELRDRKLAVPSARQ